MASQQPDFLNNFAQKMAKLDSVRQKIAANIQSKEAFANNLKGKLGEINTKIQSLAGLIDNLKKSANDLQGQVNTNTTTVADKEKQIQDLQTQLQTLSAEKDQIAAQLTSEKASLQQAVTQQQTQINQLEENLRNATQEKAALEQQKQTLNNQVQALNTELQSRGDPQAHAQEIARLTDDNKKRLDLLTEHYNKEINDRETKIAGLEQQIRDKDQQIQQHQGALTNQQNQTQAQSANLQKEIDELKAQNGLLIQRIQSATGAINQAADDLDNLMNAVPNATTQQEISALLQQIEQSIENIGRAAQGQPTRASRPSSQGQQISFFDTVVTRPIELADASSPSKKSTIKIGDLADSLKAKSNQIAKPNKYSQAYAQLLNINNTSEVQSILNKNGIAFKSGNVSGGKRTKKNRKQKGGFTYKVGIKRKSITPKTTSRRGSRHSSKNSSRNSFK